MKAGNRFLVKTHISATAGGNHRISLENKEVELTHSPNTMSSYYLIKMEGDRLSRLVDKVKFDEGLQREVVIKL